MTEPVASVRKVAEKKKCSQCNLEKGPTAFVSSYPEVCTKCRNDGKDQKLVPVTLGSVVQMLETLDLKTSNVDLAESAKQITAELVSLRAFVSVFTLQFEGVMQKMSEGLRAELRDSIPDLMKTSYQIGQRDLSQILVPALDKLTTEHSEQQKELQARCELLEREKAELATQLAASKAQCQTLEVDKQALHASHQALIQSVATLRIDIVSHGMPTVRSASPVLLDPIPTLSKIRPEDVVGKHVSRPREPGRPPSPPLSPSTARKLEFRESSPHDIVSPGSAVESVRWRGTPPSDAVDPDSRLATEGQTVLRTLQLGGPHIAETRAALSAAGFVLETPNNTPESGIKPPKVQMPVRRSK